MLFRSVGQDEPASGVDGGTILAASNDGIDVAANHSIVTLTELQRPGGKRLAAGDFLRGFALEPGMVFAKREP